MALARVDRAKGRIFGFDHICCVEAARVNKTTLHKTPEPPRPQLPLINVREQRVPRQRRRVAADREQEPREIGGPFGDERRREFALEPRAADACRRVAYTRQRLGVPGDHVDGKDRRPRSENSTQLPTRRIFDSRPGPLASRPSSILGPVPSPSEYTQRHEPPP